jgi:hypothetical protein
VDKNLCRILEYYCLDLKFVAFFAIDTKNTLNFYLNDSWNSLFFLFPHLLAIIHVPIMPLKLKVYRVTVQEMLLLSDRFFFVAAQDVANFSKKLFIRVLFFIFHVALRIKDCIKEN